uniref:Uncharacterized protein n=1 Tax=Strongyloides stercoralis TaxID=6248 RepID=A0A0K0ERS6_STRER
MAVGQMKIKIPIGILKEAQSSQVRRKAKSSQKERRKRRKKKKKKRKKKRRNNEEEEEEHEEEEEEEEEEGKEFKRISIFRFVLKLKIVNRPYFIFGIPYKIVIIASLCLCSICQEYKYMLMPKVQA